MSGIEIGTPKILTQAETEPEAAHLRGVLRRLRIVLEAGADEEPILVSRRRVSRANEIIIAALVRARTNGIVIDQLTTLNGDLQSEVLVLRARVSVVERELALERRRARSFWAWVRQRFLCWRRGHQLGGGVCLHCGTESPTRSTRPTRPTQPTPSPPRRLIKKRHDARRSKRCK